MGDSNVACINIWILFAPVYIWMGALGGWTVDTDETRPRTKHIRFKDLAKEGTAARVMKVRGICYENQEVCCSVAQLCLTLCDPMDCSMPGFLILHHLPELAQTHVHWVSDAIQTSHPLSSPSPPAFNLSQHQVFSNESALHVRWLKFWNFSFSISPSNEYSGLISFRMDWFDPLAVQGTLKSLLRDSQESSPTPQFKSISSSVLSLLYGPTLTSIHDYWKNQEIIPRNRCGIAKLCLVLLRSQVW